VKAWKDAYDAAGHLVSETPPTITSSITQLGRTLWTYDAGDRLTETCDVTITTSACSSSTRYQDTTYDKLGRPTIVKAYTGAAGSGTLRLQTTTTYLGDGFRSKSAFDGTGSSPSEGTDTIDFTEDALGRVATMKRGATTITAYAYFADGTPKTRTDESGIVTTFTEDWAGRPTTTSAASLTSITPAQTYRLDGLLDGRTWSTTNAVATLAYDGAKRPTSLGLAGTGIASVSLTQAYSRAGDVTSEGRTLAGISGNAGTGSQTFTYDGLRRVASANLGGTTTSYGYDGDGNRTTVVVGATTTAYTYDTTDELVSVTGGITGSFAFDAYGNMTANAETSAAGATTYAYDTADRLLTIGPPGTVAKTAGFTYDALGRPLTRNVATTPSATVDTYSYAGTGKVVSRISTKIGTGTAVPLDGLLGADGSRLATNQNSGAAFGWDLPDLHGNVAAVTSSSLGTITDALRYDAFGQVAASVTASLPTPWRYQGRLLVDPSGATDLYDAGARFYTPGLGMFTQQDTVTGSAQDPLSMNRFLYAEANPATFIDPDGHFTTSTRLFEGSTLGVRTESEVLAAHPHLYDARDSRLEAAVRRPSRRSSSPAVRPEEERHVASAEAGPEAETPPSESTHDSVGMGCFTAMAGVGFYGGLSLCVARTSSGGVGLGLQGQLGGMAGISGSATFNKVFTNAQKISDLSGLGGTAGASVVFGPYVGPAATGAEGSISRTADGRVITQTSIGAGVAFDMGIPEALPAEIHAGGQASGFADLTGIPLISDFLRFLTGPGPTH